MFTDNGEAVSGDRKAHRVNWNGFWVEHADYMFEKEGQFWRGTSRGRYTQGYEWRDGTCFIAKKYYYSEPGWILD